MLKKREDKHKAKLQLVLYLAGGPVLNKKYDRICQWFLNQETALNKNILGVKL